MFEKCVSWGGLVSLIGLAILILTILVRPGKSRAVLFLAAAAVFVAAATVSMVAPPAWASSLHIVAAPAALAVLSTLCVVQAAHPLVIRHRLRKALKGCWNTDTTVGDLGHLIDPRTRSNP